MSFLNSYNSNIITYDLINKFHFVSTKTINQEPQIIIQIFSKDKNIKQLLKCILALHLITVSKLKMKITVKEGEIHNCKIIVKKNFMYLFLSKFIWKIYPLLVSSKNKKSSNISIQNKNKKIFEINRIFIFKELEQYFEIFKNIKVIRIHFILTSSFDFKTIYSNFLFRSFKLF